MEDKIGTMLPCNVIVQDRGEGEVQAIQNPKLAEIAQQVQAKLKKVIASL